MEGGWDINSISQPKCRPNPISTHFWPQIPVSIFQFRWRKSCFPSERKANPIFPLCPLPPNPSSEGYSTGWLDAGRVNMQKVGVRSLLVFPAPDKRFRHSRSAIFTYTVENTANHNTPKTLYTRKNCIQLSHRALNESHWGLC